MELSELLEREGLSADEMADTVAWARDRAEELVSGLVADAELGPLLDADFEGQPLAPRPEVVQARSEVDSDAPEPLPRSSTEPNPVDTDGGPPPPAPFEGEPDPEGELAPETASALASLPPPPERPDLPEVGPGVESEPMADAAYDQGSVAAQLPGPEADGLPRLPESSDGDASQHAAAESPVDQPEVTAASLGSGIEPAGDEVTQPRALDGQEPGVTNSGSIEIDEEEIELLDDDDLEMVEDDDEDEPEGQPAAPPSPHAEGEVPEWQAALNSASMGGGAQADEDSGLYRVGAGRVEKVLTNPEDGAAPPAPVPSAPAPVERDESMDIDLGDL